MQERRSAVPRPRAKIVHGPVQSPLVAGMLVHSQRPRAAAPQQAPVQQKLGKIDILVPQLYPEGQVRPSTFKLANIVPQLLF